jgi:hypothetical protein
MPPIPHHLPRCQNTLHRKSAWCASVPAYRLERIQRTWQLVPTLHQATPCRVCGEVEVAARNAEVEKMVSFSASIYALQSVRD